MPGEQRVGAVLELHHDAFERGQRRLDLEQPQDDRLVGRRGARRSRCGGRARSRSGRAAPVTVTWTGDLAMRPKEPIPLACVRRADDVEQQLARLGELGDPLRRARCSAAPWSGCARRTRRRNRRWTSSRSTRAPARRPSTSIAHRRSAGTPRHLGLDVAAVAVRPGPAPAVRPQAREPSSRRRTSRPSGSTPGRATAGVDRTERRATAPTAAARRGHHGADHLRRRAQPWRSSSSTERPGSSAHDAVTGPVEAVGVGLQPVAQRDARHREAVARASDTSRGSSVAPARRRGRGRCSATTAPSSTAPYAGPLVGR